MLNLSDSALAGGRSATTDRGPMALPSPSSAVTCVLGPEVLTFGADRQGASRADNVPHASTSPAMIARSATVTVSPACGPLPLLGRAMCSGVRTPDQVLTPGKHELRFEFEPTGKPDMAHGKGAPGRLQLYIDGVVQRVGEADAVQG